MTVTTLFRTEFEDLHSYILNAIKLAKVIVHLEKYEFDKAIRILKERPIQSFFLTQVINPFITKAKPSAACFDDLRVECRLDLIACLATLGLGQNVEKLDDLFVEIKSAMVDLNQGNSWPAIKVYMKILANQSDVGFKLIDIEILTLLKQLMSDLRENILDNTHELEMIDLLLIVLENILKNVEPFDKDQALEKTQYDRLNLIFTLIEQCCFFLKKEDAKYKDTRAKDFVKVRELHIRACKAMAKLQVFGNNDLAKQQFAKCVVFLSTNPYQLFACSLTNPVLNYYCALPGVQNLRLQLAEQPVSASGLSLAHGRRTQS